VPKINNYQIYIRLKISFITKPRVVTVLSLCLSLSLSISIITHWHTGAARQRGITVYVNKMIIKTQSTNYFELVEDYKEKITRWNNYILLRCRMFHKIIYKYHRPMQKN